MAFGDGDLGVFFADTGVSVSYGSDTALGLLDSPSDFANIPSGSGGSSQREVSVMLPVNAFSAIPKASDQITVDGQQYTVRNPPQYLGDGKIYRLYLKAVPAT